MTTQARKKHPCPDCRQCQGCSETRCQLCRGQVGARGEAGRHLSMAEQIALYQALNPELGPKVPGQPGKQSPAEAC